MISTVITAFVSFVSTNIDDIFILMLFFSQANSIMRKRHIIIGQYLGIGILTAISIIGALGVSLIPQEYVGLLGLVPIYLGIKAYVDNKKENKHKVHTDQQELQNTDTNELEETTDIHSYTIIASIKSFINPSVIKVASITIANGGDNIGIYIPLLTNMSLFDILITVIIFLILTALWCAAGLKLSEYPFVHRNIEKYKHIFVPAVFMALGIFILISSGTIAFFFNIMFIT